MRSAQQLRFTATRFTLSTADEERNLFDGESSPAVQLRQIGVQPGQYRVINGLLCRIVEGTPPTLPGRANVSGR